MGSHYWSAVIVYNTKVFAKNPPKSWKDVWDVKNFPGPRMLKGCGSGINPHLEAALFADGVTADKIYPIDIERAFKSYDRIKAHVVKWWTSGAVPPQMLVDNEAVVGDSFNTRVEVIKKAGAPVAIEWNQGVYSLDYWFIPRGSKKMKNALKFIEFTLRPDRQAEFVTMVPVGASNPETYKLIPPERARDLPSYPENIKRMVRWDFNWWAENRDKVIEKWNTWMLQK